MKNSVLQKEKAVEDASKRLEAATGVYLVDYLGLTVEEINELRRQLREQGISYKVIKNTTLRYAAEKSGIRGLSDHLLGPTAMATSVTDEVAPARIITDFAKKTKKNLPRFKIGLIDGKVVTDKEVAQIAKLPGKKELLSMLASGLNAPLTKFIQTLNACVSSIAYVLNAVKEKKEKEENKS